MAEAAEDTENTGEAEGAEAEAAPQPNPEAEKVAKMMGWKPLDQWEGDKANWSSAEDFLVKVPEIMRNTRRKAEATQDKLNRVVAQVAKLDRNQRQQLDADLEAALNEAVDAGDKDGAKKIIDQIKKVGTAAPAEADGAFQAFTERNAWWETSKPARAYVLQLDKELNQDGSGAANPEAHFARIEREVRKEFPKLFETAGDTPAAKPGERARAPLVGAGGRTGGQRSGGELTVADMTRDMRKAADEMNVPHADWVKSYNKINAREKASA